MTGPNAYFYPFSGSSMIAFSVIIYDLVFFKENPNNQITKSK